MKISALKVQVRDKNRVNVSIDGKYRFSVDILQISELGLRVGKEYTEEELNALEEESQYGKLYTRALEYALTRPRSVREMQQYLYKKTRDTRTKTGEVRKGVSQALTERVLNRLLEKNYVNDVQFTRFWVENRNLRKGTSFRKLTAELTAKGIAPAVIQEALADTDREEATELQKIVVKKRPRYPDDTKFIAYLARQGFSYDDIKSALAELDSEE